MQKCKSFAGTENYDIQQVFANIVEYNDVINNNKYGNNYDYYRALFLLNQDDFLENGFLIVRENEELHTPFLFFITVPMEKKVTWNNSLNGKIRFSVYGSSVFATWNCSKTKIMGLCRWSEYHGFSQKSLGSF